MLFYERCPPNNTDSSECPSTTLDSNENSSVGNRSPSPTPSATFELSKELEDWIWQDNMHFIQDKNIFEHTYFKYVALLCFQLFILRQNNYFSFMWQICGYIPQTIMPIQPDITQKAAQLSTSFFIETFIHAKEKVYIFFITQFLHFATIKRCCFFLAADHGAVGRIGDETVQRLSGGLRLVPRTHGGGHLVAGSGTTEMSQSDGSTNVPAALHSRHSTTQVNLNRFRFECVSNVVFVAGNLILVYI